MTRTFLEFVEQKKTEAVIEECFAQIANEAEANQEFNEILIKEGFWSNMGRAAQGVGTALGSAWQGLKAGASAGMSNVFGPESQTKNALEALGKAKQAIQNDPKWRDSKTTDGNNLSDWLDKMTKRISGQLSQIQNRQLQQAQTYTQTAQAQPSQPVKVPNSAAQPQPATP